MDAYAIMGVEFGSSLADVTAAFRQKAKLLHPDADQGTGAPNRNCGACSKPINS